MTWSCGWAERRRRRWTKRGVHFVIATHPLNRHSCYSFTTFARDNDESLVRIADAAVAARFVDETLDLVREAITPNRY